MPKSINSFFSCLYECRVMHQRLQPRRHALSYGVFMFYLDLDQLEDLSKRLWFVSLNRFNVFNFRDADHLEPDQRPIREKIQNVLQKNGIQTPPARTMLLTYLRTWGYLFNPVSFYFCFDQNDHPLCALAEVGNTFGEMKTFFIPEEKIRDQETFYNIEKKHFYVSPFLDLDVDFEFKLRVPNDGLNLWINSLQNSQPLLTASLTGKKVELNNKNLLKLTLEYPWMTLKVITLIHWNALLLLWKRIPFHEKTEHPELQQNRLRISAKEKQPPCSN